MTALWDGTYCFSSLSEKTRQSNLLQMSLLRQHSLLSYLKTLSLGSSRGSSRWPPAQQTGALPTELTRDNNWAELLGQDVPVLKISKVFHCYLYYAPQFLSMLILTALLLAEARLQQTLQDIRALWKCSIATILRKSIDCQNSAGFNVNCSERNQPSLQNTLLCPVHYHSFKKVSSNVRPTLFTFNLL